MNHDEPARAEKAASFAFEASVAIALAAAAFLWRENPSLDIPQVYWALGALLAVNLGAGVALRLGLGGSGLAAAATVADCTAVTAVVQYSGGRESVLWVLYLMPVYSACLLLDGRPTAWVVAGTAAFDAAFQFLRVERIGSEVWFTVFVQTGVLSAGGVALWRLASRQRGTAAALDQERRRMSGLVEKMQRQRGELEQSQRVAEVGLLSGGIVHDLRTPLSVIQGFASLLARPGRVPDEAQADLAHIQASVRNCLAVLSRFSDFSRGRDITLEPCPLLPMVRGAADDAREAYARRGLALAVVEPPGALPPAAASPAHLRKALAAIFAAAAELPQPEGALRVESSAAMAGGQAVWLEVRLNLAAPAAAAAEALAALGTSLAGPGSLARSELALAREVILKHDGGIALREDPGGGCVLTVSLAAATPTGPGA